MIVERRFSRARPHESANAARSSRGENFGGDTAMQSALLVSFAVSMALGMWLIWKMTQ
jgi:hypothetical protein